MTLTALLAAVLGGPIPLLCTPYAEDGSLDVVTLAKEARFVADCGASGVIWPAANDALELLTAEEEREGLAAVAQALAGGEAWFCPCCPGTNLVDTLCRVGVAADLAARHPALKTALLVRMCDDATDDAAYERQYDAVAAALRAHAAAGERPIRVIVQTYNGKSPLPSAKALVGLAVRHPETYGWYKVEGTGAGICALAGELAAAKPAVKTVFTGWGGRDWLYHYRVVGTRGVISQRPMYADLMVRVWRALEADDARADELFAKFMYLRNLDNVLPSAQMRGWNLYVLKRRGVFRNTLSREAKAGGGWTLADLVLTEAQRAEVDRRLGHALAP